MVGLLFRTEKCAISRTERLAIRPIVEFFELVPSASRNGARSEIFKVRDGSGGEHPYLKGLREELRMHNGIYIFHDSRGRALYVGKARHQPLWQEIYNAYNRERAVQQIRRV